MSILLVFVFLGFESTKFSFVSFNYYFVVQETFACFEIRITLVYEFTLQIYPVLQVLTQFMLKILPKFALSIFIQYKYFPFCSILHNLIHIFVRLS